MTTTNTNLYQVDAFTDTPFKGNPAGVMIVSESTQTDWMQNIALEMNLAETAFVIPRINSYQIRYFTPTTEVDLCGHATLSAAHILYQTGLIKPSEAISFSARGGELTIAKRGNWIVMEFPVYPLKIIDTPPYFGELVGFEPEEVFSSHYRWILALAKSESEIIRVQPRISELGRAGLGHLMITAPSDHQGFDYVQRCFAPLSGIDEDPVTGSAQCALTPFWSDRLKKKELRSLQVSPRTGILKTRMLDGKVQISGQAVTVLEAKLKI